MCLHLPWPPRFLDSSRRVKGDRVGAALCLPLIFSMFTMIFFMQQNE